MRFMKAPVMTGLGIRNWGLGMAVLMNEDMGQYIQFFSTKSTHVHTRRWFRHIVNLEKYIATQRIKSAPYLPQSPLFQIQDPDATRPPTDTRTIMSYHLTHCHPRNSNILCNPRLEKLSQLALQVAIHALMQLQTTSSHLHRHPRPKQQSKCMHKHTHVVLPELKPVNTYNSTSIAFFAFYVCAKLSSCMGPRPAV